MAAEHFVLRYYGSLENSLQGYVFQKWEKVLERWLSCQEFPKDLVQFLAPTWKITTVCKSISRESEASVSAGIACMQ